MGDAESVRKNGPMALLLAVLAFLGIRSFTTDSAVPSGEQPKPQAHSIRQERDEKGDATNDKTNDSDRFWQPLKDLQDAEAASDLAKEIANLPDVYGLDTRCLIACVPDPIDSTSGYRFDGLIDTIQRAAETQGYVLDRYYYPGPWQKGAGKNSTKVTADGTLTENKAGSRQAHLTIQNSPSDPIRQPGVLLFRGSRPPEVPACVPAPTLPACMSVFGLSTAPTGGWTSFAAVRAMIQRPRLLLVFLVGETATAGLDKEAFTASLHLLTKSREYAWTHSIRVLGPHFSGSQVSLERTIQAWGRSPQVCGAPLPTFRVISGNATSIDKKQLEDNCLPTKVTFQATVIPDRNVFAALVEHLNLGLQKEGQIYFKDNFAVLYESNTRFGQIQRKKMGPVDGHNDSGRQPPWRPTFFPFPLHISEVRSAYDKTTGATKGNTLRLPSFGSKLRLPAEEVNRPRDVEPSLDAATTAVTSERLISQMLETLSRERFRYVFIVATDVRDKLFLASLIRQQCPECRLVFSDSDLLFSHPDFSADLRGSIVGSTYPLYARNQRWSFPFNGDKARFFFAGPGEQGYYNATIALLNPCDADALLEYGPPFPDLYAPPDASKPAKRDGDETAEAAVKERQMEMAEELAHAPIDPRRPPVWISIIGQAGLYPLAVIPAKIANEGDRNKEIDSYGGYVFQAPLKREPAPSPKAEFVPLHPGLWVVPVLGMMLLLSYVGWSYLSVVVRYRDWEQGQARENGTVMQKLFWPRSRRLRWRQQVYACVCLLSVLAIYSCLVVIWVLPLGHWLEVEKSPVAISWWNGVMPIILVFLLLAFFAVLLVRAFLRPPLSTDAPVLRPQIHSAPTPSGNSSLTPSRSVLGTFLTRHYLLLACILVLAIMATYLYWNGRPLQGWQPGESLLFAERAASLASGVSPVVPIVLIGLAFFLWSVAQLKRLYLLDVHAVADPSPPGQPLFEPIDRWHGELTRDLRRPKRAVATTAALVVWMILFFILCRLSSHFVPAAEGVSLEILLLLGLAVLTMIIVYGWLHLRKVWESTRHLLNALALLPLREAFGRIPIAVTRIFGPYLASPSLGRQEHLSYRLEQRHLLVEEYQRIADDVRAAVPLTSPEKEYLKFVLQVEKDYLASVLKSTTTAKAGDGLTASAKARLRSDMLSNTARACLVVLQHIWRDPGRAERLLEKKAGKETDKLSAAEPAPDRALVIHKTVRTASGEGNATMTIEETVKPEVSATDAESAIRRWLARAEDFVALEMTAYLSQFFAQLRNLALFLSLAPLLMLLAVTSYPFQPQRLWLLLSVALIGLVSLSAISIIVQVERNELLSRILKTTPNQFNFHWDFLSRLLLYAAPLLGILVAISSDLSDLVHAWVDPLLQVLK